MFDYSVSFQSPWYLLLGLAVPVLWWLSFRSLAALGTWRRLAVVAVRTVVMLLLIAALAEIQVVRTSDRLTVIYLLDQSLSIPESHRRAMIEYVNEAVARHRRLEDRVGVIVFGRDPAIEVPPYDEDLEMLPEIESLLDPGFTDISAALRLAQASFPEDSARRIVIVSDGNENLGDAVGEADRLAQAGVGIDVVVVRYPQRGEVIVERVTASGDVRRGEPFDLKIVVTNTRRKTASDSGEVTGRLEVTQWVRGRAVVVSRGRVTLPPGKRVFTVRQKVEATGFYTYTAEFFPDRPEDDTMPQNNRASTFAHIRGRGRVLVIEDYEHPGQFERFKMALRRQNLELDQRTSDQPFEDLASLQEYDAVVLANVPREHFSDGQIRALVRNTQQMGAGLVMLGGPNSFGAGGWAGTELEEAMPVHFQIQSAKVVPRGALAMIMHATEMPNGNFWQKVIAKEALKVLGARDYCGVLHYTGVGATGTSWLWEPGMRVVGGARDEMLNRIGRMTPGDMPDFDPGLVMAYQALSALPQAAVKHIIVISDGDPSPPSRRVIASLVQAKITVSAVAVACHGPADSRTMARLANATGGKYYRVNTGRALPRIFQKEARRVAQPLIYRNRVRPRRKHVHEITAGIEGAFPPITGYVMTTIKENPLVEVPLVSPQPPNEKNATLLAAWPYGLGKTVAFTTDAGARWTNAWTGWENYDKLFGQMVRWCMRPLEEGGTFAVATDVVDDRVRVVVTALDKEDEFLNFLDMSAMVVGPGPELKTMELKLEQTAPGRYVGTFPAREPGSHLVTISPGAGQPLIRTGVDIPYSDEFRHRGTNDALLSQLAERAPRDAPPGTLADTPAGLADVEPLLEIDHFRHDLPKATSSQDIWYYVVLVSSCLFFFDVLLRRVQISFGWIMPLVGRVRARLFGTRPPAPEPETIERLRSRKAAVETEIDRQRAGARFEPGPEAGMEQPEDILPQAPLAPTGKEPTLASEEPEESYTERLLRVKKQTRRQTRRQEPP
ncbi:MAG TPA: VWA domain-containing protein [Planctomycetes bacterium]|nr:VWA domain-containing protein [Planctomycetota bacterium]